MLLIDCMVAQIAKDSGAPMSVAWIDYQKAFDRVPHRWIVDMLQQIRAPGHIVKSEAHYTTMVYYV